MPSWPSLARTGGPSLDSQDSEGAALPARPSGTGIRIFRPFARDTRSGPLRWASVQNEDRVGLDECAARQSRDADRGAGRIGLAKITGHDLVHAREMREIGEVNGELHHVREGASRRFCDRLQVGEDALNLILDALDELPARRIEPDLARKVNGIARTYRLRVGPDRSWRGGS